MINLYSLLTFSLHPGLYYKQADNILVLNPQLFCQQIVKKNIHRYNELLNMFFHRCSYKNSCYIELVYNFSVLVLMICIF